MVLILAREIIDEFDKFLVIRQNLLYQIFLPVIANVVLATVLSIFYLSKFSNANSSIFSFITSFVLYGK